jgi:hypothetical protein
VLAGDACSAAGSESRVLKKHPNPREQARKTGVMLPDVDVGQNGKPRGPQMLV